MKLDTEFEQEEDDEDVDLSILDCGPVDRPPHSRFPRQFMRDHFRQTVLNIRSKAQSYSYKQRRQEHKCKSEAENT